MRFLNSDLYTAWHFIGEIPVTHPRQHDQPAEPAGDVEQSSVSLSRREFFRSAGVTGLAAAATSLALLPGDANAAPGDGTPEQIHLTWGEDPSSSVVVSWASPAQAVNPRVLLRRSSGTDTIHAVQRTYTDGLNGQTVFTYHARIDGAHAGFDISLCGDGGQRPQPGAALRSPVQNPRPGAGRRSGSPAMGTWRRPSHRGFSPLRRAVMRCRPWSASSRFSTCSTATSAMRI